MTAEESRQLTIDMIARCVKHHDRTLPEPDLSAVRGRGETIRPTGDGMEIKQTDLGILGAYTTRQPSEIVIEAEPDPMAMWGGGD